MLTYTEILKSRTDPRYFFTHDADYLEYEKMTNEAIEKQIPKKIVEDGIKFNCPLCSTTLFIKGMVRYGKHAKYCRHCGQAIDWSDEK